MMLGGADHDDGEGAMEPRIDEIFPGERVVLSIWPLPFRQAISKRILGLGTVRVPAKRKKRAGNKR